MSQGVFLHGMWRSGTTYLWSRFRDAPGALCFYEPLHHGLAKITADRIARDTAARIAQNGHPDLDRPYFAEYAPLIAGRGVAGFDAGFAYRRFSLGPNEAHPRLQAYLSGLIAHAEKTGRRPVLGFNRTGLRLAWLRRRFDAANVYIDREPAAIWASYKAEQVRGNDAYFSMWLRVLQSNAGDPVLAPLIDRLGLGRRALTALALRRSRHRQILQGLRDEDTYFMIFYVWLLCTRHALAHSDLVIDTRLADAPNYAAGAAREIERLSGLRIDLGALRAAAARVDPAGFSPAAVERSALSLFPRAMEPKETLPAVQLSRLSPRPAELLAAVA